ncbi:MAG: hypothetical protein BKP49_05545 [Treponema sp. CETP13]|nr:MAG: hypothetical protein BKP49_05545 [Treponema sp. CETP13]
MNKLLLKKSTAISAIILILGTTSAFAGEKKFSDPNPKGVPSAKGRFAHVNVMGIVTSISDDSLTLENADGDIISVSINPLTKIVLAPTEEEKEILRKERIEAHKKGVPDFSKPRKADLIEEHLISLSDVKIDQWITVEAFDTGTITLEASRICVYGE